MPLLDELGELVADPVEQARRGHQARRRVDADGVTHGHQGPGGPPFTLDGRGRHAEFLGGLVDGQPAEESQFDDAGLLLVELGELIQRLVEVEDVDVLLAIGVQFREGDAVPAATTFVRLAAAGVIDETSLSRKNIFTPKKKMSVLISKNQATIMAPVNPVKVARITKTGSMAKQAKSLGAYRY